MNNTSIDIERSRSFAKEICEGFEGLLVPVTVSEIGSEDETSAPLIVNVAEGEYHTVCAYKNGDEYIAEVLRHNSFESYLGDNTFLVATFPIDESGDMYNALEEIFWATLRENQD